MDRTPTIRASHLRRGDARWASRSTLVMLVVFLFLRRARATLIPAVAVPVSLVGTFGVMYLAGYSIDNLSLMALTIATGFVVDDAIVVLENISRHHRERHVAVRRRRCTGAREVGFTVLSMSLSLVAVFIPILLMGGIVGRLFREFAVMLSVAIADLAGGLADGHADDVPRACSSASRRYAHGRFYACLRAPPSTGCMPSTGDSLDVALRHPRLDLLTAGRRPWRSTSISTPSCPRAFSRSRTPGGMGGSIVADQSISFRAMSRKLEDFMRIVRTDPAVASVVGFTGGAHSRTPASCS